MQCPSDCPHSLRSPSVCIPAGIELEASFGLKPVDLASLGSLLIFQNSSQSAEATCVLALTSSTSQGCGPGRFLVSQAFLPGVLLGTAECCPRRASPCRPQPTKGAVHTGCCPHAVLAYTSSFAASLLAGWESRPAALEGCCLACGA